jgi:hypothetical protein
MRLDKKMVSLFLLGTLAACYPRTQTQYSPAVAESPVSLAGYPAYSAASTDTRYHPSWTIHSFGY